MATVAPCRRGTKHLRAPTPERVCGCGGVRRRFADRLVLDAVDLDVAPGQVVVLTGANGAGKTTLLRCVVGADAPDAGTVAFGGAPLDERDLTTRRALAAVLDDADLVPDLTVREHLALVALAHRVDDAHRLVDEVVTDLGLMDVADRLPVGLSAGQRRRALLASTAVRPFDLLVLDEPEQRLDDEGHAWLRRHLTAAASAGAAVLLASHDRTLADDLQATVVRFGP